MLLGQQGGVRVGHALTQSAMVTVNFAEVVGHYARNGGRDAEIRAILDPLPIAVAPLDHELAYQAGMLLPMTRLPDCRSATAPALHWRAGWTCRH